MSKAPAFAGLKKAIAIHDEGAAGAASEAATLPPSERAAAAPRARQRGGRRARAETTTTAAARVDKKAVVGYFHPDVNKWLRGKALAEDSTLQRVLFDLINMGRKADKLSPFPEEYESPDGA